MKKYKVEITRENTYIVDVLANNSYQAQDIAKKKFKESVAWNIEHYLEIGDENVFVSNTFDVTHTDDPFSPTN